MKTRDKLKFTIYKWTCMSHHIYSLTITPVSLFKEYVMTSKILLQMSQVTLRYNANNTNPMSLLDSKS